MAQPKLFSLTWRTEKATSPLPLLPIHFSFIFKFFQLFAVRSFIGVRRQPCGSHTTESENIRHHAPRPARIRSILGISLTHQLLLTDNPDQSCTHQSRTANRWP